MTHAHQAAEEAKPISWPEAYYALLQRVAELTRERDEAISRHKEILAIYRQQTVKACEERDEAREAARHLSEYVDHKYVFERWPWLKETT